MRNVRPAFSALGVLALVSWVCFLRYPSFGHLMWNVDETIHAAIACILLDGGTLYVDAIDQRTPLTYYLFAAIFGLFGPSLVPVRVVVGVMLGVSAWLLGRSAARVHGPATGIGTGLTFAAITSYLLFPGDVLAVHTEWFVVFFTVAAAWVFLGKYPQTPGTGRTVTTAVLLGLAALSKQSALLEIAPLLIFWLVIGLTQSSQRRPAALRLVLVSIVFAGVIGGCFALYALQGAGSDFLFYTWTYNLQYYGSEYTFLEKLISGLVLIKLLAEHYPLLLLTAITGLLWLAVRVVQFKPSISSETRRGAEVYLVSWLVFSTGAAMAGGRGYDHYFFPVLAPLSWVAMVIPGRLWAWLSAQKSPPLLARLAIYAFAAVLAGVIVRKPLAARDLPTYGPDPAKRVSEFIRQQSSPDDRIFVWGFNPDIYYYTQRLPASRFLYCTFQTGLIPWTNIADDIDTTYAIVPGSMATLIADLEKSRPRFIIDSSAGVHRHFDKYSLDKFPVLRDWIESRYVELESQVYVGHGFRVWARSGADEAATIEATGVRDFTMPSINLGTTLGPGRNHLGVSAQTLDLKTPLTGIGLEVDGRPIVALDLYGVTASRITIPLDISTDTKSISLRVLARAEGGVWEASDAENLPTVAQVTTPEQQAEFAIPAVAEQIPAIRLVSSFGAELSLYNKRRTFAIHAPGLLAYEVRPNTLALRGFLGLEEAAQAPDNAHPSDGAEFVIRLRRSNGTSEELLRRAIQPQLRPTEKGEQAFRVELPLVAANDILTLEINPGLAGDASSDWTYWRDLTFETYP